MATIHRFEDLRIWQAADKINDAVWAMRKRLKDGDPSLWDQLNRSSGSISDNIAEGFGRGSRGEFVMFLGYARGSASESRSQVHRARKRGLVGGDKADAIHELLLRVDSGILNFTAYLNTSPIKGLRHKDRTSEPEPPPYGKPFCQDINFPSHDTENSSEEDSR